MPEITILTEKELRSAIHLDREVVTVVEAGFRALATSSVRMPPILRLDIPEHRGEMDVKTAYVPGIPSFALKVSPGFFDNPKLGLPSLNGLMILFSATTGLVEALLLDNGYLTDIRTAAAGAVAAEQLARKDGHPRRHSRRRCPGPPAARGPAAGTAHHNGGGLGPQPAEGGGLRGEGHGGTWDSGTGDAEPWRPLRRERYRGDDHAQQLAPDLGRGSASRPAYHRHGRRFRA